MERLLGSDFNEIAVMHALELSKLQYDVKGGYPCFFAEITVNFLNIRTPQKFVVITLKFELCGSTIE